MIASMDFHTRNLEEIKINTPECFSERLVFVRVFVLVFLLLLVRVLELVLVLVIVLVLVLVIRGRSYIVRYKFYPL